MLTKENDVGKRENDGYHVKIGNIVDWMLMRYNEMTAGGDPPVLKTISLGKDQRKDVLTNLRFIGFFPTPRWSEDPLIPKELRKDGVNKVADVDLTDATGRTQKILMVINTGLQWGWRITKFEGFWGCSYVVPDIFDYAHLIPFVQFRSTGDPETTVLELPTRAWKNFVAPTIEYEECAPHSDNPFFHGLSPGVCKTPLQKIMGCGMEQIMGFRAWPNWKMLPYALLEEPDEEPRSLWEDIA